MSNPADELKVLVTGGAGFIGRRVVTNLLKRNQSVTILDNLYTGVDAPDIKAPNFTFYNVDLTKTDAILDIILKESPDIVIHLAAIHHIPTCEKHPSLAMDTNILGTQNLLDAMEQANTKSLILASSGAVYDWTSEELTENVSSTHPNDYYGLTKFTNEHQARIWSKRNNATAIALRIFNTIGHDDPNGHLIPDILRQIDPTLNENSIYLGNVAPKRDYIHANDTASAISFFANNINKFSGFDYFNVCSGTEYSVTELVQAIGKALGTKINIIQDPSKVRKIDRLHQLGNNSRLLKLGWHLNYDFNSAISDVIKEINESNLQ